LSKENLLEDFLSEEEDEDSFESFLKDNEKNLKLIEEELSLISSDQLKDFVKAVLSRSIYFWDLGVAPQNNLDGDILGDLWPTDTYKEGGNVVNTQRVVRIFKVLGIAHGLDQEDFDLLIAAALIHAATKYVPDLHTGQCKFDVMYPYTLGMFVRGIRQDEQINSIEGLPHTLGVDDEDSEIISRIVRCHRGAWSLIPEVQPATSVEMILHMACQIAMDLDYIVDGEEIVEDRWAF